MIESLLFWAITTICCGYCFTSGSRSARYAALGYAATAGVTLMAQLGTPHWSGTPFWLLLADTSFMVFLYALALLSRRFWPLWMAGFQLVTVATHVASLTGPAFLPRLYTAMSTLWSVPILLVMLIGVILDNHAGLDRPHSAALPD